MKDINNLQGYEFNGEIYYIANELSNFKGLNKDDYNCNWKNRGLPGHDIKLEGKELKGFKDKYKELKLGRINSLFIVNKQRAEAYLKAGSCELNTRVHFLEKDIEQALKEQIGGTRQVKLDCGRLDLMTDTKVVELKKDKIDCNAVGQLLRYLKELGIKEGMLVGVDYTADALLLIKELKELGYDIKTVYYSV